MTDRAKDSNVREKPTTLGQFIRQRREERGLLRIELAKLADLSPSLISSIENGTTPNPSILTVKALGKALRAQKELWEFITKL